MNAIYSGSFSKDACTSSSKLLKLYASQSTATVTVPSLNAQLTGEGDGNQKSYAFCACLFDCLLACLLGCLFYLICVV